MKRYRSGIQRLWVVLSSLGSLLVSCERKEVTFSKDVQPVIIKNCAPCHRPGGGAPFSLITYEDVSKRARMVAHVTSSGYMPPWPADRNYSKFLHERGLAKEEIEMIKAWYEQGAKPGDKLSASISIPEINDMGRPDMVLDIQPIHIQGDNRDRFYVIKIPYEMPRSRYVRAVQFVTTQPAYAHHMNGHYLRFSDDTDPFKGERVIDIESDAYEQQFMKLELLNRDGSVPERVHSAVNYLPGAAGIKYPAGIGGFIMTPKGAFVANDIHYGPSRKNLVDSPKLYIYFSDQPPQRPTYELMLGTNGVSPIEPPLQVPAGRITSHTTRVKIHNDISVLTVNPHMHMIGKTFRAYALKPNGDTVNLVHIPQWRFRWQYFYTFPNPVRVPKGSTIVVDATFDNTAENPDNPFDPPRPIGERLDRGGASMRATDEMLQFIITYMPYEKDDERIDLSKPVYSK